MLSLSVRIPFNKYKLKNKTINNYSLSREEAMKLIVDYLQIEILLFLLQVNFHENYLNTVKQSHRVIKQTF